MSESTNNQIAKTVTAHADSLHVSPRKCRLVTNAVKGMFALDAITQLRFTDKKASPMVEKLIRSAIANAEHNFQLKPEQLYISSITCDMGKTMRRYMPRARGSASVIRRKLCHINLVLSVKAGVSAKTKLQAAAAHERKVKAAEATSEKVQGAEPKIKDVKVGHTGEQRKMNTAQNKRRLFNRKSGE